MVRLTKKNFLLLSSVIVNSILLIVLVLNVQNPKIIELGDESQESSIANVVTDIPQVIGEATEANMDLAKVVRVIDGDTIVLDNGKTLRYIGIDTPEITKGKECFSDEAKNKNSELVLGKTVRLEKDISETDRYGRLLRYVYVNSNFINEILVSEGYANAVSYPPDIKYQEVFRISERDARESDRGLWSKCE